MKIKQTLSLVLIFLSFCTLSVQAQTPYLSQYWLAPQFSTPTAVAASDYLQLSAHFRRQAIAEDIGYTTSILSGQLPLYNKSQRMAAAGLSLLHETSGHLDLLTNTGIQVSYAHDVQLVKQHHLLAGIQTAYFSRKIDWSKVTTDMQWQYGQYYGGPTGENFTNESSNLFQVNVGLGYHLMNKQGQRILTVDLAANNVNGGFFKGAGEAEPSVRSKHFIAQASYSHAISENLQLNPIVKVQQEQLMTDFIGGFLLKNRVSNQNLEDNHIGLGVFYSPAKTANFSLQYAAASFGLAISYDLPFGSDAKPSTRNAVEVSLSLRRKRL